MGVDDTTWVARPFSYLTGKVTFLSSHFFPLLALNLNDFLNLCFHPMKNISLIQGRLKVFTEKLFFKSSSEQ